MRPLDEPRPQAAPGVQALDFHIAAECFFREFWDLRHIMLPATPAMTAAGFKGEQDLPHCEELPEGTRICFMRANIVRAAPYLSAASMLPLPGEICTPRGTMPDECTLCLHQQEPAAV